MPGRALLAGIGLLLLFTTVAHAQNGPPPWALDLMVRVGDGVAFGPESVFSPASGVPSVISDGQGRLIAAFQWFPADDPAHFDRVAVMVSNDDGGSWSPPQPIEIPDLPGTFSRPFDPTLAALDDGRIRIYFSSNPNGQLTLDGDVATYSAISNDGVHYTFEPGVRFGVSGTRVIDPAVLRLGDTWHYTAPIGRPQDGAYHATSANGLEFTRLADIPSVDGVNWTGNLVAAGTGMRFYGGSSRGVWWAFSSDGIAWTSPTYLSFQGGDPSVAPLSDGRSLVIYVGAQATPGSPGPPGAPPPAPGNPTARVDAGLVTLSWLPAAGAQSYRLEVGTSPGGHDVVDVSVGARTSASGPLPPGSYFFRVFAFNGAGQSPPSAVIPFVVGTGVPGPVFPPGAPGTLTATTTGGRVTLDWSPPTQGSAVIDYILEVGSTPGSRDRFNNAIGPIPTLSIPSVLSGRYFVRVRARNGGGVGPASNEVVIDIP